MKNLLLISALCCSSVVFSGEQLNAIGDRVYDNDGHEYINEGSFNYPNQKTGKMEKRECIPLAEKMNPNASLDNYPPGTITREECKIKRVYDGKLWQRGSEKKQLLPIIREENTVDLSAMACDKFAGYAPPSSWSPYSIVYSHFNTAYFTLKYKWHGSTMINGMVRYFGTSNDWVETVYFQQITILTGEASATIKVAYKGIPLGSGLGSSVDGEIC